MAVAGQGEEGHPFLPGYLSSRLHAIQGARGGSGAPRGEGEFVLYWLRTAQRAHENPALDVAVTMANHLGLPVLVYHALSERYPYASDRHHRFILEGARDVAEEMAFRGLAYAFHLEREGHRGPHLVTLARRAALVVTEDLPVRFLEEWSLRLASAVETPVWAVDTACLVPARTVPREVSDRAFRFRSATARVRRLELGRVWPLVESRVPGGHLLEGLPFIPLDLQGESRDLDALVAACAIDHAVGPVPHTPGGSRAGYQRWEHFRDQRLKVYHRTRNDPLRDGVSRMSAYLHYGMVSPFRIAREAAAAGGEGAEKYLDELLVWRELAHAFCVHNTERDSVDALPGWALETLREHAPGARGEAPGAGVGQPPTLEALSRGRTGDRLWDAAQRSLLIHGELHNNVRMTWGKALPHWSRSPEEALARLLDLNHRFALDGRDPSSYGGLLWCLGQFDRPFHPPRPILGTVRPRSTADHARRLDVEAYSRRTSRPAHPRPPRTLVIGAGVAGLICARTLADHGVPVTVLDKGRRPGGRLSTRASREGGVVWDHGAQFFTARDPRFRRHVDAWLEGGVVAPWEGRLVRVAEGVDAARESTRYVGMGGMQGLAAHLAQGLHLRCGVRVTGVERREDGWWVQAVSENRGGNTEDATADLLGPFDVVVVAVPAPQAVPLLGAVPGLSDVAARVPMAPCWAGMLAGGPGAGHPWDAAFLDHPVLDWVARQGSRPGNGGGPDGDHWVVHGSPGWSQQHLDEDSEAVGVQLREAFAEVTGVPVGETSIQVHRWRYALPLVPHSEACLWDGEVGLGGCGDWCGGPRVEGAFLSGLAMAGRILAPETARLRPPGAPGPEGGPPAQEESRSSTPGGPGGGEPAQGDLFGGGGGV
jgi:photolyase PhrII